MIVLDSHVTGFCIRVEPILARCWAYRVIRYRTTFTYKFYTQVEESRHEGDVLEIPHRLEMFSIIYKVGANSILQAGFVRLS